MKNRTILYGDVLDKIKEIDDTSIDCIITSPPYYAVRSYGVKGQLGLEPDFNDFLKTMQKIMKECYRVLKNTGTCFVNFGDTYESKSLMLIPQRFLIQCVDNGWSARNDLIWIKPNNIPSSKIDAFTNKYEHVFFFTKSPQTNFYYNENTGESLDNPPKNKESWKGVNYYFDLNSVRVKPVSDNQKQTSIKTTNDKKTQTGLFGKMVDDSNTIITEKYSKGSNASRLHKNRKGNPENIKQNNISFGADGKPIRKFMLLKNHKNKAQDQYTARVQAARANGASHDNPFGHPAGKNPGDIIEPVDYTDNELLEWIKLCRENNKAFELTPHDLWYIKTSPMCDNHHATFPINLPKRALLAGCAKQVCVKCGKPRIPIRKPTPEYMEYLIQSRKCKIKRGDLFIGKALYQTQVEKHITAQYITTGHSKCNCNAGFKPGVVLDPFLGSGTTGIAAEQLNLHWIGIELNKDYIDIARKRLEPYLNNKIDRVDI